MIRPQTAPELVGPDDLADALQAILDEADGDLQYHGGERRKLGCRNCELVDRATVVLTAWRAQTHENKI